MGSSIGNALCWAIAMAGSRKVAGSWGKVGTKRPLEAASNVGGGGNGSAGNDG
jgi:hypothetical protein